jgi:hypothetical protein
MARWVGAAIAGAVAPRGVVYGGGDARYGPQRAELFRGTRVLSLGDDHFSIVRGRSAEAITTISLPTRPLKPL